MKKQTRQLDQMCFLGLEKNQHESTHCIYGKLFYFFCWDPGGGFAKKLYPGGLEKMCAAPRRVLGAVVRSQASLQAPENSGFLD